MTPSTLDNSQQHRNGNSIQGRVASVLSHIIFIVIICILPDMLMRMASPHRFEGLPWWVYGKSAIMIAVFYINYFIIIQRTLIRRHRWWEFILLNLLLITAAVMAMHYIGHTTWKPRGPKHHDIDTWRSIIASASFITRDAVMLFLTVALAVALRIATRWLNLEKHRREILDAKRESELQGLRSQLNPHFLFNTLNSIYALIEIAPEEAQQAVHKLSKLLRYLIYENPETVQLTGEIDFISDYIALMRLRLGDRPVNVHIDNQAPAGTTIPPLMMLTLVENAFKHGNTPDTDNPINITITASPQGEIKCQTNNHFTSGSQLDKGHGIGLANLRRRLELIYGDKARLTTTQRDNIFTATLRIQKP